MLKLNNLSIFALVLGLSCAASSSYAAISKENLDKQTRNYNQSTVTEKQISKPASSPKKIQEKVSINKATTEELQKVKYIGKVKAKAIVDYRTANGEFKSLDDLLQVKCKNKNLTRKWLDKVSNNLTI